MQFTEVKMEQWPRKEHYEHYINNMRCTYSLTVDIDISSLLRVLKGKGMKSYPAQIYMLSTVVNQFAEFRMSINEGNRLGYWDEVSPMYTIMNRETETFSAIWTRYDKCFSHFYQLCLLDMERYKGGTLFPQKDIPPNVFNVSSLPWLDFTAFNLNVFSNDNYLMPIFTIGKYKTENRKILMPLAIQCHHAVCDGFHVGKFVAEMRRIAMEFESWL